MPLFAWCSSGSAPLAIVFLLTAALGATNGSLTVTSFLGAADLSGVAGAELCGVFMVFTLMLGLLTGSFCAWLWLL